MRLFTTHSLGTHMDRIEIAVRIIERTVAVVISNGTNINIDALVNDAFNVADKVLERGKEVTQDNYPSWANWIAQDADGRWWYYEYMPSALSDWWWSNSTGKFEIVRIDDPNPNWRDTLRRLR